MSCQEYAGKNRKANSSHLLANPKQNQEGNVSMNELTLASHETNVTMSSREIAELTGKAHHHVVRDIEKMFMELDFNYPKTDDYVSKEFFIKRKNYKGRSVIDEIGLDQDLTMTLMTGYSVPLRHKVSKRWRELESGKQHQLLHLMILNSCVLLY